ncbi:MAG: helix-turn-helix transcriptional regulator [Erysipelotrichales bacterium]|nr:helix-turn-helix transcriptional regulator [Erysipelotrichales bacterium]
MDTVKIGRFLAQLRKEKSLTQEQLAEELGVNNKTISRWETGNYMPPVEMLLELSKFYDVSINEILCGERLSSEDFKEKAESNLKEVLSESKFSIKEKKEYFKKKWQREHFLEHCLVVFVYIIMFIVGINFNKYICTFISLLALYYLGSRNNRMMAYVETMVYGDMK